MCRLEVMFRDIANKVLQPVGLPDHTGTRGFELDYPANLKFRAPTGAVKAEVNGFVQGPGITWFDDLYFGSAPVGRVAGRVLSDGSPVQGTRVYVWGDPWGRVYEDFTDAQGQYAIEDLPVAFPRYILLAEKTGYRTQPTGNIAVSAGEAKTVDFDMVAGKDPNDDLQVRFGSLELVKDQVPAQVPTDAVLPADANGYPESVREYLKADAYITADDPEVLALANQILAGLSPDNRSSTYKVAWAVYEWICRNVNHDAVFGTGQPYQDVTSGIWQTIQEGGWSWGRNFYDWGYKPADLIRTRCGICVEHSWLACALLRGLNVPARAIIGSAQFWVQRPGTYGYWVGLSASGGSNTYRETGYLGDGFGRGASPAFFSVTSEPLLHEDWSMQAKGLWRETHPWGETYDGTTSGMAQATADLATFTVTGSAPNGTQRKPGQDLYQINYSAITVNLYNVGDQRTLDVRFPIVMDSATHRDMDRYAYWTNHPECVKRTWIETVTNPPVEGTQRWFHIEFDLTGM